MITLQGIRKKAENKYFAVLKAEFLRENPFPLNLPGTGIGLKTPFKERLKGIEALKKGMKSPGKPGYELNLCERSTQKEGIQTCLQSVFFPSREDYYGFLGKRAEIQALEEDIRKIRTVLPELGPWIGSSLRPIIQHSGQWDNLIKVLVYFRDRITAGLYLREVPLELPTKFPEQNEAFLRELLDIILPEERIKRDELDLSLRYGLKKDRDFRFRILSDPADQSFFPFHDLAVLPEELAQWRPSSPQVLIVENKLSFLLYPERPGQIKIWGSGKGIALLRDSACWLGKKDVIYWGDLDPQGFEILSLLREFLPDCRSLCMDKETFQQHREFAVMPGTFSIREDLILNEDEAGTYHFLTLLEQGALEQEKLPMDYVLEKMNVLV